MPRALVDVVVAQGAVAVDVQDARLHVADAVKMAARFAHDCPPCARRSQILGRAKLIAFRCQRDAVRQIAGNPEPPIRLGRGRGSQCGRHKLQPLSPTRPLRVNCQVLDRL